MEVNTTEFFFDLSILDHLVEGYQVIDENWRYQFVNDSVIKQGRMKEKSDLLGYTMMEKYPGIEHTELFEVLKKCMEDRQSRVYETKFTFPDESQGWFELRIGPVPGGIFILSMDITERRNKERGNNAYLNNAFWG